MHGTVSVAIPPSARTPSAAAAPSASPAKPSAAQIGGAPRGLVYAPTGSGVGNGQAFFFFFGFSSFSDGDLAMRQDALRHIGDDVAALRAAGYHVVLDLHGDLPALDAALRGAHADAPGLTTAGIHWCGHGNEDGSIEAHDGTSIRPDQISPEATQRASVRLFVMHSCHAGGHDERWRKALGPQAPLVGWGAPITHARAISFLVHDDQSSKGFDDLLARHLGAKRVTEDSPLSDAIELSRKHEDRVALLSLGFDELVKLAQERLTCPLDRAKTGEAYFTVRTPPTKDAPQRARAQVVRCAPVGVGKEFVVVETLLRRRGLHAMMFANNLSMVGSFADKLEHMFFGTDRR